MLSSDKNKKIKVAFIFGTRPEAIKIYPVIREVKKYHEWIKPVIILTAQHREMLDQMIHLFSIEPDFDLQIMQHGQSISHMNAQVLLKLEEVFQAVQPDLVLVQGDTTSTFSGALSAFYHKIRVGHIEAGLRTSKKYYPYPEEMNRRLTTVLADYHFTPTESTAQALFREGISKESVLITGNTVIDTLFMMQNDRFQFSDQRINNALSGEKEKKIILVTMHRRENWGEPLENLCQALSQISSQHENVLILFPIHKNPVIRKVVFNWLKDNQKIILLEPLNYQEMVNLMSKVTFILTDSGGIQEEAPALGKPVLILRSETERPEVLAIGAAKLIGTKSCRIREEAQKLLTNLNDYQKMVVKQSPYGDGFAANRIVQYILYQYHFLNDFPSEFKSSLNQKAFPNVKSGSAET